MLSIIAGVALCAIVITAGLYLQIQSAKEANSAELETAARKAPKPSPRDRYALASATLGTTPVPSWG